MKSCPPIVSQAGAVVANAAMWCVTPVLAADISSPVTENEIKVSLPVYIVSLLASISFTWVVAKYDNQRIRKMDELAREIRLMREAEQRRAARQEEEQ